MSYSDAIILAELREILKLVKEISDKIGDLADKIYEDDERD